MSKYQIRFEAAIGHFGSAARLAEALGITESAVSQWRGRGVVPEGRSYQLAALFPEVFRVEQKPVRDESARVAA